MEDYSMCMKMNYSHQQTNFELVLCIVNLILLESIYNFWYTLRLHWSISSVSYRDVLEDFCLYHYLTSL